MGDAFYIQDAEDRFVSTEWTTGPWSNQSQHAGPPAALLGRAVEGLTDRDDVQIARATFEILRPVPVSPLQVRAEVVRPGRSVILSSASLADEKGVVMEASAWSIRTEQLELKQVVHGRNPPGRPDDGGPVETFPSEERSYLTAMEWRFVRGGFLEPGPATAWARMRHPLVDGEEIAPLSRVLALADSGNGISAAVDFGRVGLHQSRPQRLPPSAASGRVGLPRCRDDPRADRDRSGGLGAVGRRRGDRPRPPVVVPWAAALVPRRAR